VEHADLAFHASWFESQRTAKEEWSPPLKLPATYLSQKEASFEFDSKVHEYLIDNADTRGAQRLRRAQPHACGFITAVPSDDDGKDTILPPRNFRIAVAYRLGVTVINKEIPCPLCTQLINTFGDHATCCTKSGDLIIRHNSRIGTTRVLAAMDSCLQFLKRKVFGVTQLADDLEMLPSSDGQNQRDWQSMWQ